MKAMILAAGLGTRLRPLTDTRPKALVEINGRTLLEITLTRLRAFGVTEVIINVHHFADMVVEYLKSKNNFGMRVEISREDDLLLDTGGGLKKASWFFLEPSLRIAGQKSKSVIPSAARNRGKVSAKLKRNRTPDASGNTGEPLLLHNVDVISTIDFRRMLQFHNENRALATLAVQSRESSRLLLFNDQLRLVGRAPASSSKNVEKGVIPKLPTQAGEVREPDAISQGLNKKPSRVIPSEARNPGKVKAQPNSDQTAPPALSSNSPLATRHSPLPLAFSGIHIISPRLLPMLTEEGVFSIIDAYLRLAAQGEKILAFRADEYYWRDLGRPADLSQAALDLQHQT